MSDKKEVVIPESVGIVVGGEPWSYERCVQHVIDSDKRFNETGVGIRAAVRILASIKKAVEEKSTAAFDSSDLKLLNEAMESPQHGWIPQLSVRGPDGEEKPLPAIPGRVFITYIDATA
jgi:hypothetical protein